MQHCEFRFYGELNDFLRPPARRRTVPHVFAGTPSVKDRIESLGVPHTEVDLIVVDGVPVGFDRLLTGGERVAVYPPFQSLDLGDIAPLRPPLGEPRFVLDVHLGRLARYLRLLGFDSVYSNDRSDDELLAVSRGPGPRAAHQGRRTARTCRARLRRLSARDGLAAATAGGPRSVPAALAYRALTRCARCNGLIAPSTPPWPAAGCPEVCCASSAGSAGVGLRPGVLAGWPSGAAAGPVGGDRSVVLTCSHPDHRVNRSRTNAVVSGREARMVSRWPVG